MIKKTIALILFQFVLVVSIIAQVAEYKTVLDFEDKTIRLCLNQDNHTDISILTAWDYFTIDIVPDPQNKANHAMKWIKNNKNQTYGGFAFGMSDVKEGLDLTGWKYFSYQIKSEKPFSNSTLKFVKEGDITIYENKATVNFKANEWVKVLHPLAEHLYTEERPVVIIIMPASGESVEGTFLLDNFQLER